MFLTTRQSLVRGPFPLLRVGLAILLSAVFITASVPAASATQLGTDAVGSKAVSTWNDPSLDAPDILCDYAALVTPSGETLFERSSTTAVPIASISKIMTCIVAIKEGDLASMATVSEAAGVLGASYSSSSAGLKAGDKVVLEDLLYAMMLPSGNDAALAVAETVAGSEAAFVEMMNAKAASLGMSHTTFVSCNGYTGDEGEVADNCSSASDLALLCAYCMRDETFRQVVSTSEYTAAVSGTDVVYTNTNSLLATYEGMLGIKTGATDGAGMCVCGGATRDDVELYAIILHSGGYEEGSTTRFEDCAALLDWGFRHYRSFELVDTSTTVADLPLTDCLDATVPVRALHPVSCALFEYADTSALTVTVTENDQVEGAIAKGEVLGEVRWYQGDTIVARTNLVAENDIEEPSFFQSLGTMFSRLFRKIGGKPTVAEQVIHVDQEISLHELFTQAQGAA